MNINLTRSNDNLSKTEHVNQEFNVDLGWLIHSLIKPIMTFYKSFRL